MSIHLICWILSALCFGLAALRVSAPAIDFHNAGFFFAVAGILTGGV